MAVSWAAAQGSLVEVYRCFRGTCCFHHQGVQSSLLVTMTDNDNFNQEHISSGYSTCPFTQSEYHKDKPEATYVWNSTI
jgi:hypothetical protein